MSDMRELYQQVILDHNRNPRNFGTLESANRTAEGYNPLCGDHYTFFVEMDGDVVRNISFQGSGCAISKASASVMSSIVKGKNQEEVAELFEKFHQMVTGSVPAKAEEDPTLGRLAAFGGVSEHPSRIKCATLAWHTMNSVVKGEKEVVSTE